MTDEKFVGEVGDIEVVVLPSREIELYQNSDFIARLNLSNAAHLSALLDKAIGLAKGGVELDEGLA